MASPPPGPPPGPGEGIPPRFHTPAGRRTLALFGISAMVLVAGFLVFAGAQLLLLARDGPAGVVTGGTLPPEVPVCTAFQVKQVVSGKQDQGRYYRAHGECPENANQFDDDLTRDLEYTGWTVHDDGQGELTAYAYARHELVIIDFTRADMPPNVTAVTMQVSTAISTPPPGFPSPPSPSPA